MKKTILFVLVLALGLASVSLAAEETWTKKADMPTARLGLSTSVVNGKIYAIGGGYSIEGPHSRTVEEYDPVTDTWTKKADMPTGRLGHSASVVNAKIYVIGGDLRREASGATVEEYAPITDTWTTKADMPTKRTFLCTCAVDGRDLRHRGYHSPCDAYAFDRGNVRPGDRYLDEEG
ncbi:N-acetylneuraminate epimerase [subsurface metagenome]